MKIIKTIATIIVTIALTACGQPNLEEAVLENFSVVQKDCDPKPTMERAGCYSEWRQAASDEIDLIATQVRQNRANLPEEWYDVFSWNFRMTNMDGVRKCFAKNKGIQHGEVKCVIEIGTWLKTWVAALEDGSWENSEYVIEYQEAMEQARMLAEIEEEKSRERYERQEAEREEYKRKQQEETDRWIAEQQQKSDRKSVV